MSEPEAPDPLAGLEARIDRTYASRGRGTAGSSNALATGLRIGLELVVGVVVGAGAGYALDRWLGVRPWGLILGLFLGVAAGMVNVHRAMTGVGMAAGYAEGARRPPPADDDTDED